MGFKLGKYCEKGKREDGTIEKECQFGASHQDFKDIYIIFIRSVLYQSATVWHSSLTDQNKSDLERVQKASVKVILKEE